MKSDITIAARVSPKVKKQFTNKCKSHGTTSTVLRELIVGFIEDRVTITPPEGKESLYVTGK